jgi:hypothetical protein
MKDIEVKKIKMDCTQVNKVSPYVDGNLSYDQKKTFEKHLQNCKPCHEVLNQKVKHLQAIESLIPLKHLSVDEHRELESEITELFNSFGTKSKFLNSTKKMIDKVIDLF